MGPRVRGVCPVEYRADERIRPEFDETHGILVHTHHVAVDAASVGCRCRVGIHGEWSLQCATHAPSVGPFVPAGCVSIFHCGRYCLAGMVHGGKQRAAVAATPLPSPLHDTVANHMGGDGIDLHFAPCTWPGKVGVLDHPHDGCPGAANAVHRRVQQHQGSGPGGHGVGQQSDRFAGAVVYEGLHQFDVGIPPPFVTRAQCIAPSHPGHFIGKSPVHSITFWEADEELVLALAQQALTQDVMPTVDTVVNVCRGVAGNHSITAAMIRDRILDESFLCNLTVSDCVRLGKALGEMGGTASESTVVMVLRCATRPDLLPRVKASQARCLLLMLANLPEKYHDEPMKWCLSSLLLQHLPLDAGRMLDVMWALGTLRMDSKEITCPICNHLTSVLENQPTVTTAEWTCVAWTMARNRWFHLPLVDRLLKHAKEELHHSNVEVISTMLWSLSRLGVQTKEILHEASLALLRHMNLQDNLSTMACVLWLYVQHNHLKDEPALLHHIVDCIASCQVWTLKRGGYAFFSVSREKPPPPTWV